RRATHMCTRGGRSLRRESGQVFALAAVVMSGVIGMLAFVVDVGSWYRSHRSTQALVDASALAGAEDLPYDQSGASSLAASYASKNGGPVPVVTFPASDTIDVAVSQQAPGIFATIYGNAN